MGNDILNIINGLKNPEKKVRELAKEANNPVLNNMIGLAEKGNTKELENVARNIFKQRNIDFDKDILPFITKK